MKEMTPEGLSLVGGRRRLCAGFSTEDDILSSSVDHVDRCQPTTLIASWGRSDAYSSDVRFFRYPLIYMAETTHSEDRSISLPPT